MVSNILSREEVAVLERFVPEDAKARLLAAAHKKTPGPLYPVYGEATVEGGFRSDGVLYVLWYNDEIDSTHTVTENIFTGRVP